MKQKVTKIEISKDEGLNLRELTAPCGLDCFNCPGYLANDNEEIRKQLATRARNMAFHSRKHMKYLCAKDVGRKRVFVPLEV